MGCGCGGSKTVESSYRYTSPDGSKVTVFRTEIEAKAAVVRNSGGTYSAVPR